MNNQEMLMAAIEFEEVELAYDLYYLIANGIINAGDEFTLKGKDWNKIDGQATREMREMNLLGFDLVDLYCVRLDVDTFEVIGAKNEQEARGYFMNRYSFLPKIIKMDKSKWLKYFWFQEEKTFKSLQEIRKESNVFPRHLLYI